MINDYSLPVFSCFSFALAMFCYWTSLAFPKNQSIFRAGTFFVCISNFLLVCTLAIRWWQERYFPLSNLYESLLFLSWALSFIHLFIEFQTKSRVSGALSTPFLFFLSGFASFTLPLDMQKALPLVPSLQSNWLMMHVSMMMVSYATLLVGSLFSILYLCFLFFVPNSNFDFSRLATSFTPQGTTLGERTQSKDEISKIEQDRILSTNQVQFKSSFLSSIPLPSSNSLSSSSFLQTIDLWSYRIIGFGFPCLTLGILSGAVWANEAWGSYWSWDPKETWALITWLTFASYLHSRLLQGWQGKKAATIGAGGFFIIWICYLGVNFLGKGLHTYGWVF